MSRLRPITTSDPSSEEARLVRLVRPPPPMSAAQAARCRERVTELARAPVTPKLPARLTTIGAAFAVVIAGGTFVAIQANDAGVRSAPQVEVPSPSTVEPRAPATSETVPAVSIDALPSVAPAVARSPKRDAVPGVTPAVAPSRAERSDTNERDDTLTRELRLVDGARVELAQRPGRAHELLVRHAAEFPTGQLASEREVLLVDALIRLDRRAEAEARARSLVAREPGSPYAQRVEALLSAAASSSER